MNSAFINRLDVSNSLYIPPFGSETDFVWSTARNVFI